MAAPAANAPRTISQSARRQPAAIDLDAARPPVALGRAADVADDAERGAIRPDRVGHRARVVEEPFHLALVDPDAGDLALDLIADIGERRKDAHVRWQSRERIRPELVQRPEIVPPR